jgi:uncharacterized membrane protein YbhN (UPF0104 family)
VEGAPRPGFLRRNAAKLALSALVTGAILWGLKAVGLKLLPIGVSFAHVRWWTLPVYIVLLIGMSWFRAVRWRFLLRRVAPDVSIWRLLSVSWIGFAAILLLPFRLGELVRPVLLADKSKKITFSTATGSVVAERVIDGLYLSIVLAVALLVVPHVVPMPETEIDLPGGSKVRVSGHQIRASGFLMLGVFVAAFAVIAVFYFARSFAHRATLAVFGRISRPLGEKLAGVAERLADGLHFLGSGKDAVAFLLETSGYWFLNAAGMWLLAWGCGLEHADGTPVGFGDACAMMGMLGIAVLIPGPPGLLGTFQAGIYAGMVMYLPLHVALEEGAAYVFLLYATQVVWTLLAGAIFLVGDRRAARALFSPPEPPEEDFPIAGN